MQLTRKTVSLWHWTSIQDVAFRNLKTALASAPVLSPPDFLLEFHLSYNASETTVGAVLSQTKVIGYYIKTLSKVERNYSVTDKEFLNVLSSFFHYRPYLHGSYTKCTTDHESVVRLVRSHHISGRRAPLLQIEGVSVMDDGNFGSRTTHDNRV